ncbi:MAG: GldG family protein [Oscillospiraceae bacterium]|nr:GldG family protein [Oscillospiraceae bacterium]
MSKDMTNAKKPFNKKKLKYGAVATAITVFVIAIVVFINLIAGLLTERKGLKLDLTAENYYEISQDTIDYIKALDTDVEIAVMMNEEDIVNNSMGKIILESLAKYEQNSDCIEVNYYDIEENPDIVNKFAANYNGEISEGSIIIASGDRVKATSIDSLFTIDTSSYYQTGAYSYSGYKGESEITAAVMNVTDANPVTVAIAAYYNGELIYHSDLGYTMNSVVELLDKNGYSYEVVDILADELSPEAYDMVILPAPVSDLTDDSITKLEDFLYNNGNLDKNMIYIADILQRKTPKLDAFLEVWGIEVTGDMVEESDDSNRQQLNVVRNTYGMAQTVAAPVATISDSTYSEGLSNTKLPVVVPATRNINLLFDANVDRTTTALLTSSESSVLYPLNLTETKEVSLDNMTDEGTEEATEETEATTAFDINSAEKGSNVVMALASKVNIDANDVTHTNNLLVIGGASFIDPYITGSTTYNNAEFFVNTVNRICNKESAVIIAEKHFESSAIDITASQVTALEWVVVAVIPAVVAICGIFVFIRRRNR